MHLQTVDSMHWPARDRTPTHGCSPNSHTHWTRWSAGHGRASAGHGAAAGNAAMDAAASGGGRWTSAPRDGWDAASRSCVCGCRVRVLDTVKLECAWWERGSTCFVSGRVRIRASHALAGPWEHTHARTLTKRTRAIDQVARLALSEDRPDRRRRAEWGHRHRAVRLLGWRRLAAAGHRHRAGLPLGWHRLALRRQVALHRRRAGHPLGWHRLALRRRSCRRRHRTRACDGAGGWNAAPFWPALMLRMLP